MKDAIVKVQPVGDGAGIILPENVLAELQVGPGDTLFLVRTERGFELTASDPALEEAMANFDVVRRKHRDAFRRLAQ